MMRRNKMSAFISKIFLAAVMTGAIAFWTARGQATPATDQAKTTECWVSILPQKFFVERIGGGHVVTHVLVGPGQSPATFEPTGRQLTRLADAEVFFSIGVAYEESLIPKIKGNFPDVRIVDVSSGVPRRQIEGHRHNDANGPGKVKEPHALVDPHIWLSPRLAIQISANILMALCDIDSARCDEYTRNFEGLQAELFRLLDVIRVYSKPPHKPVDRTNPFILPTGSTVADLAAKVHRGLAEQVHTARIWGTGVYDGQNIPVDHVLHDKDVVELRAH